MRSKAFVSLEKLQSRVAAEMEFRAFLACFLQRQKQNSPYLSPSHGYAAPHKLSIDATAPQQMLVLIDCSYLPPILVQKLLKSNL